jgi:hypothetical protein
MEPYPECAKKPLRQPPNAQQVFQELYNREQIVNKMNFKEFKSFDQAELEKFKIFDKYVGLFELPGYNLYCKI